MRWSPRRSSALGFQYKYLEEMVSKDWMAELEEMGGPLFCHRIFLTEGNNIVRDSVAEWSKALR